MFEIVTGPINALLHLYTEICGEMVIELASSVEGSRFDPRRCRTRILNCYFAASSIRTQNWGVRVKNCRPRKIACLSADCCFLELAC